MTDTLNPVLAANEALVAGITTQASEIRKQISSVDEQLGTSDPTGRVKILDAASDNASDNIKVLVATLAEYLESLEGDARVSAVALVQKNVRPYNSEVKSFVEANTPEKVESNVPNEEVVRLRADRKKLVDGYKSLRAVIVQMAPHLGSEFPEIENLRGAGPGGNRATGERLKGSFKFNVDGTDIAGTKLGDVQKATGATSVGDVRLAITQAYPDFDFKDAPSRFEFTVNGKKVVATSTDSDTDEDSDDEIVDVESSDNEDIFGS